MRHTHHPLQTVMNSLFCYWHQVYSRPCLDRLPRCLFSVTHSGKGCESTAFPICVLNLTWRKEKSLVCSIMVISRLPITISQPLYMTFIRLYWISEFPVVLRTFWVPEQMTTGKVKNSFLLMSVYNVNMSHEIQRKHQNQQLIY